MTGPAQETVKHGLDVAAVATAGAAWFDYLPDIAAAISIIWLLIRIWETRTIRGLIARFRKTKE